MDLLSVLDRISRGQWVSAKEMRDCLAKGYADWHQGKMQLTNYGLSVLNTLGKAA